MYFVAAVVYVLHNIYIYVYVCTHVRAYVHVIAIGVFFFLLFQSFNPVGFCQFTFQMFMNIWILLEFKWRFSRDNRHQIGHIYSTKIEIFMTNHPNFIKVPVIQLMYIWISTILTSSMCLGFDPFISQSIFQILQNMYYMRSVYVQCLDWHHSYWSICLWNWLENIPFG